MTILSFVSCTGGPGVTTTAVATAAAMTRTDAEEVVLVEAALSGGVIASQYDLPSEPGLTSLALALSNEAPDPLRHAQELPGGLPAVVAPLSAAKTTKLISARGLQLSIYLRSLPTTIVADCGRLAIGSPIVSLLEASSLVGVVVRPTREDFRLSATTLAEVSEATDVSIPAGWVLVGESPWSYEEITEQYGLPVLSSISIDRSGAEAVAGRTKMRRRSPLARSAQSFADDLVKHLRISKADAPLDYLQSGPDDSDRSVNDAPSTDRFDVTAKRVRATNGRFTRAPDDLTTDPATTEPASASASASNEPPRTVDPSAALGQRAAVASGTGVKVDESVSSKAPVVEAKSGTYSRRGVAGVEATPDPPAPPTAPSTAPSTVPVADATPEPPTEPGDSAKRSGKATVS